MGVHDGGAHGGTRLGFAGRVGGERVRMGFAGGAGGGGDGDLRVISQEMFLH